MTPTPALASVGRTDTQLRTATGAGALGGYVWLQQMEKPQMQAVTQGKGVAVTRAADR